MKLDMHCHTREGSPDSKVPIMEYIRLLKEQGFDGMLVTDHDSYGGYEHYLEQTNTKTTDADSSNSDSSNADCPKNEFVVLRGIEYDTFEAGHFIVIMPDGVKLDILEHRGLPLHILMKIVHAYGGIIGPAHPCGEPFLSIFSTGIYRWNRDIAEEFDFIEGYNCGEDEHANEKAQKIAAQYNKPMTAGSDAHWYECVGLAETNIEATIRCNNDLIEYIKSGGTTSVAGVPFDGTIKARLGKLNKILVYGFFPYNKLGALRYYWKRKKSLKDINI